MFFPSMIASAISGILIFIAFLLFFKKNKDKQDKQEKQGKQQIILLLFSIAIGIHGISHLGLEYIYHYPRCMFKKII
jgi:uncharacterized membrane protein YfcA